MFLHRKELIQPVKVGKPDARFGTFLLEQFGGATGELTAALQYWVQSFHVENAGIRDMLQDIAIEEFGHLEMVGKLIAQHTSKLDQTAVFDAPLFRSKAAVHHPDLSELRQSDNGTGHAPFIACHETYRNRDSDYRRRPSRRSPCPCPCTRRPFGRAV